MEITGPERSCRLYVLPAAAAPVALVLRRGPSAWWHVLRWDLAAPAVEPGAWFHGTLYPRRCDVSPDGRWFGYFALKATAPAAGWPSTYFAVSRGPWLEALAAWKTCGTWTWGCRFAAAGALEISACVSEKPFHGSYPRAVSIGPMKTDWPRRDVWNETKRGWQFAASGDPLIAGYEGKPDLVLRRVRPGGKGKVSLGLIHRGVNFGSGGMEGVELEYFLQYRPDDVTPLPQAAWADWDHQGRLLIATRQGTLEIYRCEGTKLVPLWSEDLRGRTPDPQPAPEWASRW